MSYKIYDSSFIDKNGNKVVWSNDVSQVLFYDASAESWDRTGAGTPTWYTELFLPNDDFYSGIESSKWSTVGASDTKTISISDKALFSIEGDSGSLYLSSQGLWSLTGDFDIRLGINIDDYYDEYWSAVSFGLNVSSSDGTNNVRVAVVRNYDLTSKKFQSLYTEDANPLYFGWTSLGAATDPGGVQYLSIKRVGSSIRCYLNSTQIGSTITGSKWSEPVYVSIGSESPEINTFKMSASFFNVVSGVTTPYTQFNSQFRGPEQEFPEKSLIITDSFGLSIVDYVEETLWMRFRSGENRAFNGLNTKIEALNGRVYYTSSDGFYIIDFIEDRVYKYKGTNLYRSSTKLALRNSIVSFDTPQSVPSLLSDNTVQVSAKNVGGSEFVVVATTSGINVIIDRETVKQNTEGHPPATSVYISDNNKLYWSNYNSYNEGDLSYYNNISLLSSVSGTAFSRSGYLDSESSFYRLSSENVTSIHSCYTGSVEQLVIGTAAGLDVFLYLPDAEQSSRSFGIVVPQNPIMDPLFSSYVGRTWKTVSNTFVPCGLASRSSEWSTNGNYSLKLQIGNSGLASIHAGDYTGVYQRVDFTPIDRVYFDVRLVGVQVDETTLGHCSYEVVVDSDIVASFSEPFRYEDNTLVAESIDVSSYSGFHDFMIRVKSNIGSPSQTTRYAYFSNFRVGISSCDYNVLGGTDPVVSSVFITYSDSSKKVVYSTSHGYGSIDLVNNTSDFFIKATDVKSGMLFNSACLVEDA